MKSNLLRGFAHRILVTVSVEMIEMWMTLDPWSILIAYLSYHSGEHYSSGELIKIPN